MLDVRLLRNDYDKVAQALKNRNASLDLIAAFPQLDVSRREKLTESEQLKTAATSYRKTSPNSRRAARTPTTSSPRCGT